MIRSFAQKKLHGQRWYEIDDVQDLDIASSLFMEDEEEKLRMIESRYGGYWRYPHLKDFCYLVNPYFPSARMMEEMKANFAALLTQYPSGMRVNSLLAGKNFNLHSENVLVGNGAAELIKFLMESLSGKTGFIRPTFEEYPNRYKKEDSVFFEPSGPDFSYSADDLIHFYKEREIRNLVVVNPDNPTGNYIPWEEMMRLVKWTAEKGISLIVDESFADFAEEEQGTLLEQELLEQYPQLYVVKSISKCYGVPGLRLGVLASGDQQRIAEGKREVAIWNINSFAEFYLQIAGKYAKEYEESLKRIKSERARFAELLGQMEGIRVIPSQANYLMLELTGQLTSRELTRKLLTAHSILVKDLSKKITSGQYLRVAVRNEQDNDELIRALRCELR